MPKQDDDFWAMTAIHESAHGIVAFALDCNPVELNLYRRGNHGTAGNCVASYEQTWYGKFCSIFTENAPFTASQHGFLPCAEIQDLPERNRAYDKFCSFVGRRDQNLFRERIDLPLIAFFRDPDIQTATLYLSNQLYAKNKLSMKNINYWNNLLDIPTDACEDLQNFVVRLVRDTAG